MISSARRTALVVALASLVSVPASRALADEPQRPGWAFGSPAAEGVLGAVGLTSNATLLLPQRRSAWAPDHTQQEIPSLALASDIVGAGAGSALQIGTGYLLESAYLGKHGAARPGVEALHEALVEAEALSLDAGTTSLMKRLAGRCRPWGYASGRCAQFDAFPSGHTSAIAAIAGARLVRAAWTSLDDRALGFRLASFGLAEAGTLAAAILRVTSGAHSVEDVVVGAVVGHVTGVMIALAHPPVTAPFAPGSLAPRATTTSSIGLSFGGQF